MIGKHSVQSESKVVLRKLLAGQLSLSTSQGITPLAESKTLLGIIICLGIVLRVAQYLHNRSLWVDEALLALNIVNRSFLDLLTPLDYHQGAPLGFLIIEKSFVEMFGQNEYALRLFPLFCGIASLFLFSRVAKNFLDRKSFVLAMALFAISYNLIYYTSEVKQYSSDVAIALVLYAVMLNVDAKGLNAPRSIAFGTIGGIMVWLSHPATFVIAGISAALIISFISQKDWRSALLTITGTVICLCSFAILYFVSLSSLTQNKVLLDYWSLSFMPFPPGSLRDLKWFDNTFVELFKNPLGFFPSSIAAAAFVVGWISMAAEKRQKCLLLTAPLLGTLLASGLHRYPFSGRLLLFAVPAALIFIVEGVMKLGRLIPHQPGLVSASVAAFLLIPQVIYSSSILFKPHVFEDIKPAIEYMRKRWHGGDIVYLYGGAQPTFKFYAGRYNFTRADYIIGQGNRRDLMTYEDEIDALSTYPRLWILFSNIDKSNDIDDEALFREYLKNRRELADMFKTKGTSVYLYKGPTQEAEALTVGLIPREY